MTARHLTFFEMMGNFSFGDYFKEGADRASPGSSPREGWELDPERIWATVFGGDEHAAGRPRRAALARRRACRAERIVASATTTSGPPGPTGPCGPCSELYYDRGAEHGCDRPDCAPGCSCDRFLEYWNLVFMQYDRGADGTR